MPYLLMAYENIDIINCSVKFWMVLAISALFLVIYSWYRIPDAKYNSYISLTKKSKDKLKFKLVMGGISKLRSSFPYDARVWKFFCKLNI